VNYDFPDRLNTAVWTMLAILGALLALIAWYSII
jgi:hypothetical protein